MTQLWAEISGGVTAPQGFRAAGIAAGLKPSGSKDLALVLSDTDAIAAATFTTNAVKAACVTYGQAIIANGNPVRAIVCNSGQANACTGVEGDEDNHRIAELVATSLHVDANQVMTASTGVIGQRVDITKFETHVPTLVAQAQSPEGTTAGPIAAETILTTDLVSKTVALEADLDGHTIRVGGMCKGSGMIHPNMATMLAFVTCDAAVDRTWWQQAISAAVDCSFNQISVDTDTSTNDMAIALSNGHAGNAPIDGNSPHADQLQAMLNEVFVKLAKAIARDGEGATKLIEVQVKGAATGIDAREIARSISASPLVKSAAYGNDPNWGRIAMAAGKAGVQFDSQLMDIFVGDFLLMKAGKPLDFDRDAASEYLKGDPVVFAVDLHQGEATGVAWGCDLSYDYVRINAEYTT